MRFHTPQTHSSDDKYVNSVELEVTFFMFQVNGSSGDHRLFITDDDIGQVGTATVDLVTALMSAILIAPFLRHLLRIPKLSREIMQFQDGAKQPKKNTRKGPQLAGQLRGSVTKSGGHQVRLRETTMTIIALSVVQRQIT